MFIDPCMQPPKQAHCCLLLMRNSIEERYQMVPIEANRACLD